MAATRRSTSLHCLSADSGLRAPQAALYLALNWLNNRLPGMHSDPRLERRNFVCADLPGYWPRLYPTSSPSRKLSDLFWMTLPWGAIQEELGAIHVFDTGCGSGNYGVRLQEWSGGALGSYTGSDVVAHPSWQVIARQCATMRFL